MNKHTEHINDLERMHMAESVGKWYGWGSPIGLSIFFITLVGIAAAIKWLIVGSL